MVKRNDTFGVPFCECIISVTGRSDSWTRCGFEVEETKWRAKSVTKLETSPVVLPSWELTCYPSQPALLKMIFLKVGYYLLVSWRVKSKKHIFVDITGFTNTMMQYVYTFWTNNQPNYHFCLFMNFLEIWGRFKFLAGIDSGTCVYK